MSADSIVAWGSFATVVLGGIITAVVSWRKQRSAEAAQGDVRADTVMTATIERLDSERRELKSELHEVRTDLTKCKEGHARVDEQLKHLGIEAKRCTEEREILSRRLDDLEDTVRQK